MLYFLLLLGILLLPIYFRLTAKTENDALTLQAELMLVGKIKVRLYRTGITVKKVVSSLFSPKKQKPDKARIFNSIVKHTKIKRLNVQSNIGTSDASSTAIISGQLFGLLAPLAANVSKNNYNLDINPVFDCKQFDLFAECILSTNLVKALLILYKIFGGKKNGKASY
ncbi:MAG: DUF2953 domain-containing protein [Clostridia bacterium]|nr:DUF2953 domain-containing protein [Clostridia bacterium]